MQPVMMIATSRWGPFFGWYPGSGRTSLVRLSVSYTNWYICKMTKYLVGVDFMRRILNPNACKYVLVTDLVVGGIMTAIVFEPMK